MKKQEDKMYLSEAYSGEGRRYSEEYFTKSNLLGEGGYGFVRLSRRQSRPDTEENHLATKVIAKNSLEKWQEVEGSIAEAEILMKLSHDNILRVKGLFQNDNYYQLIMERCSGVTLFDLIDLNHHMEENLARIVYTQVLDAVFYLHEKQIVHNDIKDENIMVGRDFKVTIIDFGSASVDDGQKTRTYCGSETYTSPEVLSGARYYRVDQEVWSLGVLLYVMVYGENPFENVVKAEECILKFPTSIYVSRICRKLLSSMLTKETSSRPRVEGIFDFEWIKDKNDNKKYLFSIKFE